MGALKDYNRKYNVSGGQWFLFIAFIVSLVMFKFDIVPALIFFGIIWLISAPFRTAAWVNRRLNSRPCPVCGLRMPNGETQCSSCGMDFTIR